MKKIINILIIGLVIFLYSCGAASQRESEEARIADSIRIVDSLTYNKEKSMDSTMLSSTEVSGPEETLLSETPIEKVSKNVGEINHVIKDTMNFGVADNVEITISYNCPKSIIVDSVKTFKKHKNNQSNVITQPIKITPEMRARLIDPTGNSFVIIPITDTIQIVEVNDSTFTLWQWRVTPIKSGDQNLVLSVDMIVGDAKKSLKIYQDKIYIHIGFWTKVWIFIQKNWTYITYIVGGIFAIFGWLYKEKIIKIFKP